jgi:hypothetical protein
MDVLSILCLLSAILMLYGIGDSINKARNLQQKSTQLVSGVLMTEEDI